MVSKLSGGTNLHYLTSPLTSTDVGEGGGGEQALHVQTTMHKI